jgi:hypothetical protein
MPSALRRWGSLRPHEQGPIREWSMVWLRDYARSAASTRRTYQYAVMQINADVGDELLARLDRPCPLACLQRRAFALI